MTFPRESDCLTERTIRLFSLNFQESLRNILRDLLNSGFALISQQPFMKYLSLSSKVVTMIWNYPFSCPYMWYTCAWKIIRGCFGFFATTLSDWPKTKSGHFVIQSEEKKQSQSRPARKMFPAIRVGNMSIVTLIFDWFSALSVTFVIYFGFALTTLNWQPFYGQLWLFFYCFKNNAHL